MSNGEFIEATVKELKDELRRHAPEEKILYKFEKNKHNKKSKLWKKDG